MKKKIIVGLGILLLLIQFIRPDQSKPDSKAGQDFQAITNAPPEIHGMLKAACYDCHSNESVYPWYSQIAPVSWWISAHISEGREHLNFSTFGQRSAKEQLEALEEISEVIQEGEMPLSSYTWLHSEARLSPDQVQNLVGWLGQLNQTGVKTNEEQDDD